MKRPSLAVPLALLLASLLSPVEPFAAEAAGFALAPADEPAGAGYTWHEAVNACEAKGLALPSVEEMATLFCPGREAKGRAAVGGCGGGATGEVPADFTADGRYWTSSRYNDGVMRYWNVSDGTAGYYGKDERLRVRCVRPAPGDHRGRRVFPYAINDVDEESFDYIIDTIVALYADEFARRGKQLVVTRSWEQEEEGARSWFMEVNDREANRIRQVRQVELIGGLARHPMLNRDAYAMVVCHEIGHHVGGAPVALGYSAEGQADYFAAAKCMKRYLRVTRYPQPAAGVVIPADIAARCTAAYRGAAERTICRRNIRAGLALSRWIAHSREVAPPRLTRRDASIRRSTLVHGYPVPQCRLDTLIAGALCPVDERLPFADDDAGAGACTREAGQPGEARPRCWFNPDDAVVDPSA